MFPLHDDQPTRSFPIVTLLIITINAVVFIWWQLGIGLEQSVATAALVPHAVTHARTGSEYAPIFTSMFMHGGWMHLIGNMWFLWIFGNNIEDNAGHFRFLLFYLLCGVAAAGAYVWFNAESHVPLIGASGAVSGVLGAYLVLHPNARVLTFIPLGPFIRMLYVPAFIFLLLWIGLQVLSQAAMISSGVKEEGGVAYLAHIGGFVAGIALIFCFQTRRR